MTKEEALAALAGIRTPIVYDAVEKYELQPRMDGLMDTSIRSLLPGLGPMVGYATTAKIAGEYPAAEGDRCIEWKDLWRYVQQAPGPNVMVVQDLDQPPGKCCAWGDIAASIFLRLGAVGAVTNGGARDLREVEALGFQLFASSPVVGHGYMHWVEMNTPVKIGSLLVYPGDLLHGDEHGVMVIPGEIELPELVALLPNSWHRKRRSLTTARGRTSRLTRSWSLCYSTPNARSEDRINGLAPFEIPDRKATCHGGCGIAMTHALL